MNVDEFIAQRGGEGEHDSEGDFTVDSLAAFRTTLAASLPEPHFYLFQALQALVKCRTSEVKVAVGRRENKITFHDQGGFLSDLDALASRFRPSLTVASNDPYDLIMSSLVTSLGSHVNRAELCYGDHKISVGLDGLSRATLDHPVDFPTLHFYRTMEKGLSFSWSRVWGARKEEFRIRKAFEYSPLPLSIAGLTTSPHSRWRRGVDGEEHFALLEAVVLSSERPNHRGEAHQDFKRAENSCFFVGRPVHKSGDEGEETAVAPNLLMLFLDGDLEPRTDGLSEHDWQARDWSLCLTSHLDRPSEITFVRNGCSLERATLDLGCPGVQVVAPADDLQVDASGYQLVRNALFEARCEQAREICHRVTQRLKNEDLTALLQASGWDPKSVLSRFSWLGA